MNAQSPSAIGDPKIYFKPYPAPVLPPAGGTYVDPTFGTTITRVTDATSAPNGASVNSASTDSMFNADGSMFYLLHDKVAWVLYSVNRTAGTVARIGNLSAPIAMDGAAWHPTKPSVIYGVRMDTSNRILYEVTLPAGTSVALHNFDSEIPTGGFPSSRVQVSSDGRYFGVTASTFGSQDQYDYVAVWDRQTGTSKVLSMAAKFGPGVYLHSFEMDNTGQYIRLSGITEQFGSVFWHWADNTFSTSVLRAPPDYFGGHKVQGAGINLNMGRYGDEWLTRSLATPHSWTSLLTYPRKNGMPANFEDSHASRIVANGTFFDSRDLAGGGGGAVTLHSGSVWKIVRYIAENGSANVGAPDFVRYRSTNLTRVTGIPSAPGQWAYDGPADTVYVWLPDSSDPRANRSHLHIVDWRPMMEEVTQILRDSTGAWTWRRLAHHRSHYTGWGTDSRANADPTGSFVLFQSNWDGSPRTDVFLIWVPGTTSSGLAAPTGLTVR